MGVCKLTATGTRNKSISYLFDVRPLSRLPLLLTCTGCSEILKGRFILIRSIHQVTMSTGSRGWLFPVLSSDPLFPFLATPPFSLPNSYW